LNTALPGDPENSWKLADYMKQNGTKLYHLDEDQGKNNELA